MRAFNGGEGIWYDGGTVHFSTKGDNRVWAYDTATGALGTIYDKAAAGPGAPLSGVDNLTVNPAGEVFVCEDGDDMQICVIEPDGTVAPFLQLTGEAAVGLADRGNELAGVIFDPSHRRLYFSAQRAYGFGAVYEVRGPFHGAGGAAPRGGRAAPAARRPRGVRRARARAGRAWSALGARGLALDLRLGDAVSVVAALRSDELGRVPGQARLDGAPAHGHARAGAAQGPRGDAPAPARRRAPRGCRRAARPPLDGAGAHHRRRATGATAAARRRDARRRRSSARRRSSRRGSAAPAASSAARRVGDPEGEVDRALGRREVDGGGGVVGLVRAGGDAALVEAGDRARRAGARRRGRGGAGGAAASSSSASAASCAARRSCGWRARHAGSPSAHGPSSSTTVRRRSARSRRSCARSACGPDAPAP